MRKQKSLFSGWVAEFLFVAAIYSALFCLGWLFAGSQFVSAIIRSPSVHSERGPADGGAFKTGKLLFLNGGKCKIGQFSNIRPEAFEVVETECDRLGSALEDPPSDGAGRGSRIETIGRYFRGR